MVGMWRASDTRPVRVMGCIEMQSMFVGSTPSRCPLSAILLPPRHCEANGRLADASLNASPQKLNGVRAFQVCQAAQDEEGRYTAKNRRSCKRGGASRHRPFLMFRPDQAARLFQTLSAVMTLGAASTGRKRSDDTLKNLRSQPFKAPSSRSRS